MRLVNCAHVCLNTCRPLFTANSFTARFRQALCWQDVHCKSEAGMACEGKLPQQPTFEPVPDLNVVVGDGAVVVTAAGRPPDSHLPALSLQYLSFTWGAGHICANTSNQIHQINQSVFLSSRPTHPLSPDNAAGCVLSL